jgi:hypothetical protein
LDPRFFRRALSTTTPTPKPTTTCTSQQHQPSTYDHRRLRTELPVRSAELKQSTGGLVVRWVTTGEYPLLYVFLLSQPPRRFFWKEEVGYKLLVFIFGWIKRCGLCRIILERRAGEVVCTYALPYLPPSNPPHGRQTQYSEAGVYPGSRTPRLTLPSRRVCISSHRVHSLGCRWMISMQARRGP